MSVEEVIKYVFCSYRGILIVHDIHGKKIDRLCGEMTLEKYKEIERLSDHNTEFDGLENYKRFASEQEEQEEENEDEAEPDYSPFSAPVKAQVYTFAVENTSSKSLPVVLFGAAESIMATNFGNIGGVTIDKPQQYSQFLARTISQPIIVKSLIIQNVDKINGVIEIKKKSATGATSSNKINIAGSNPFGIQQNVSQHQLNLTLDGYTEFNFEMDGNSKVNIQLLH